jgi:hypothetical protein
VSRRETIAYAERLQMREVAQEVDCDECDAPAGAPCVRRDGVPLEHMDHASRLTKAGANRERNRRP